MKITFEADNRVVVISDDVVDCYDTIRVCLDGLIASGFHPESVQEAIIQLGEEYSDLKQENENL